MTEIADARAPWLAAAAPSPRSADDVLAVLDAAIVRAREGGADDVSGDGLRDAVAAAREAGIPWGIIGDHLGMARGNAYQKYRKRPA
ncbi:hypothetical protein MMAD_50120 [Mycolicibacterium madagascariense]|jgi:hypothetical protein|uniref:Uncharacterized protein n=1 Tax=Mycolicibacterium madagascariense TaxID=212765 RepID=A0A7I7XNA5_9MYCO|nr:hypothetical protein [Mycolicibacterium madagascariense]MCV7015621.1 hypothetical protein [Mycolicibacterium madagascariense]BBZ30717.1 hypothetical protein MMAD_50120 [Mycolicibacterium madagascariense]